MFCTALVNRKFGKFFHNWLTQRAERLQEYEHQRVQSLSADP
jgi:hypothetical protein